MKLGVCAQVFYPLGRGPAAFAQAVAQAAELGFEAIELPCDARSPFVDLEDELAGGHLRIAEAVRAAGLTISALNYTKGHPNIAITFDSGNKKNTADLDLQIQSPDGKLTSAKYPNTGTVPDDHKIPEGGIDGSGALDGDSNARCAFDGRARDDTPIAATRSRAAFWAAASLACSAASIRRTRRAPWSTSCARTGSPSPRPSTSSTSMTRS